jgi:SAM-dependent methyltransferase
MSSDLALPLPPTELMQRVGHTGQIEGLRESYELSGRQIRTLIEGSLPADWSFEDKRILDFGCGSGRALRHFVPEADQGAEFWGSEIDAPSVEWINENLAPRFRAVLNGESPPIDLPDDNFDLIYAISVFTHITDEWASWLVEMHRLLKPEGLLFVSILGKPMLEQSLMEEWDGDRVGHLVAHIGQTWDRGGPLAFNSEWWLRAHWGRAFEIVTYEPCETPGGHDHVLLRRKPVALTRAELEAPERNEPRELLAAQYNIKTLGKEVTILRQYLDSLAEAGQAPPPR